MTENSYKQKLYCPKCGNEVSGLHCPNCGLEQGNGHPDDPLNYYPRPFTSSISNPFNPILCGVLCGCLGPLGCLYFFYGLNKAKNVIGNHELPFYYDGSSDFSDKESFIDWTRKEFLTDGNFVVPSFKDSYRNDLLKKFNPYYERLEIQPKGSNDHFWFLFRHIESKSDLDVYRSEQLELSENLKNFYGQEISKKGNVASFDHAVFLNYIYYTDNLEEELDVSDFIRLAGEKYGEIIHDKNIHQAFSIIKTEDKSLLLPEAKGMNLVGKMMLNNLRILFGLR